MKYMYSFAILTCLLELCQLLTGDPFLTPSPKSISYINILYLNKTNDSKIACFSLKRL